MVLKRNFEAKSLDFWHCWEKVIENWPSLAENFECEEFFIEFLEVVHSNRFCCCICKNIKKMQAFEEMMIDKPYLVLFKYSQHHTIQYQWSFAWVGGSYGRREGQKNKKMKSFWGLNCELQ